MEKRGQRSNPLASPPSVLALSYLVCLILFAFGLRLVSLNNLPLSLSLDEAVDSLDALQLTRLPWITPFLQNNFGRETLFFYLQGLALCLYGISIFSLRFASVLAGTLTIPLLYRLGQRLALDSLTSKTQRSSPDIVSLLAATGLAVSYWHIYFSRVGLRAIFLPLLLLGAIYCFWRGWFPRPAEKHARRVWLIGAGCLLGLTFYTYLAARLLPLLFIIFIGIELIRHKSDRSGRFADSLILGGTTALILIPLALYFQQNPQALTSRAQALTIFEGGAPLETLLDNFTALLHIHFLGNTWLGQWPALDLLSAAGLLGGLLICLYRIKKPAYLFLLLWWVIGTAPVLLSQQDWQATTTLLRGIMAWPALFLISALGLAAASQHLTLWLKQQAKIHNSQFTIHNSQFILPLLLLLFGGLTSLYNYFSIWATTYNNFSDHPPQIARYLNNQTSQLTLTPLQFYGENAVNFLLQAHYPYLRNIDAATLHSLLTSKRPTVYLLPNESTAESVFLLLAPAANGQGTAYLLPPFTPAQTQALAGYSHSTVPLSTILDGEQEPIAQVYPLAANAPFLPATPEDWQPLQASFKDSLLLTGYRVEPALIKPGETATLLLNWQVRRPIDGDYYLFIHLFDVARRQRWGQVNTPLTGVLFNAHRWPAGLAVPDVHTFTLPADAPVGPYRFELGLYEAASQQRLPVTFNNNAPSDDKLILGKIHIQRQPSAPPQFPFSDIQFGDSLVLTGLDLPTTTLHPGQTLSYTLHWQALRPIPQDYTIFIHLLDATGMIRAQQDNQPLQGQYPTSWWDSAEIVIDPHELPLPSDLAPGLYTLRVGLYQPETGKRLPLKNGEQDFVDLPESIKLQN